MNESESGREKKVEKDLNRMMIREGERGREREGERVKIRY